jgi:hypothetical protein
MSDNVPDPALEVKRETQIAPLEPGAWPVPVTRSWAIAEIEKATAGMLAIHEQADARLEHEAEAIRKAESDLLKQARRFQEPDVQPGMTERKRREAVREAAEQIRRGPQWEAAQRRRFQQEQEDLTRQIAALERKKKRERIAAWLDGMDPDHIRAVWLGLLSTLTAERNEIVFETVRSRYQSLHYQEDDTTPRPNQFCKAHGGLLPQEFDSPFCSDSCERRFEKSLADHHGQLGGYERCCWRCHRWFRSSDWRQSCCSRDCAAPTGDWLSLYDTPAEIGFLAPPCPTFDPLMSQVKREARRANWGGSRPGTGGARLGSGGPRPGAGRPPKKLGPGDGR